MTSVDNFEQLQAEFVKSLDRNLDLNEIEFLHWLAEKIPGEEASLLEA